MQSFFISSTFRDMQGERDAIHRTVMPQVRILAKEYGQSVQFVDLRWGIFTADMEQTEAQEKILEVCLREIDAIDQLIPDEALLQSWFIPAEIPKPLRLVVSTTGKVVPAWPDLKSSTA